MGKTNWAAYDMVLEGLGLEIGADGTIDTSGLEANEAKLVNGLHGLYINSLTNPSSGYSYQTYNPAAEQTNILKQKLEKYTGTINKRYGLSSQGASERAILKAQQDAARRIGAALPSSSGGGGGGGYDLDAEAEAVFEEYYNAVQGTSETPAKNGTPGGVLNGAYTEEEEPYTPAEGDAPEEVEKNNIAPADSNAIDALLAKYIELLATKDKEAAGEQIRLEGSETLSSRAAYDVLLDRMASKDAYDMLVEILEEGTPEYFTRKTEELYPDLVGDDKKKFDELVEKYMADEDAKSIEANEWYKVLGGEDASIEDLQMLLNKFPDASASFRLALFDLIERKQSDGDASKYREEANEFVEERKKAALKREWNEEELAVLMSAVPETKDMTAMDAAAFLEAIDEYLNEDGELDTSKVSQEWWDKNIADKYAEVWEKYGDYFEEEKAIDEETYQKRLAGEKAFVAKDGKEWYILRSSENDAADFLERHWDAANDALAELGYDNLKNPDIETGTIIEVNGAHLMYDDGQWRYVTNNKNAYKKHVVINGYEHKLRREMSEKAVEYRKLGTPEKNTITWRTDPTGTDKYIYYNGKWYEG